MTRKKYDRVMKILTYVGTSFTALILLAIIVFTFNKGVGLISWNLLTGNYESEVFSVEVKEDINFLDSDYEGDLDDSSFYSKKWGIVLKDTTNKEGNKVVKITYIHEDSPLKKGVNVSDQEDVKPIEENYNISDYIMTDNGNGYVKKGAKSITDILDGATTISTFAVELEGGGIRGSIISTLYLIIITLLITVPFGVITSIYLNEYAVKSKAVNILKSLIDMLTGIPSIIYGLLGAAVFIPIVNSISKTNGNTGSILAGALTMSVILLPVIVKTTTEALNNVPKSLRSASLALGATNTQTTFKVVLPNTIPGILSGIILGIGRIVGESAALIFAMGTLISDKVEIFGRSTTLSVHIWSVMAGETPNFELASAIALIILFIVLILNLLVKLISLKFNKMSRT